MMPYGRMIIVVLSFGVILGALMVSRSLLGF
jgi:hypothetical protein